MPKMTPKEAADKWSQRATASVGDYTKGINRVTESPTIKAAQAQDKMLANLMEAVTSGRWRQALENVSLESWKKAASEKGSARMAAGVQGAVAKQEAYYRRLWPFLEGLQSEINAMPNMTIEDSIARSAHFQREMHRFKLEGG